MKTQTKVWVFFVNFTTFKIAIKFRQLMKQSFTIFFTILICFTSFAQESTTQINTVDNQFRTLYKNSNNYQEYKVIKKSSYGVLHNNVLDSIRGYQKSIGEKNLIINTQKSNITTLEKNNSETTTKLNTALEKEHSIAVFGFLITKNLYATIVFSIILLLIAALAFFIYKFKNSNVLTVTAKTNLEDVENEFNLFRKKSLEREQKLRRELQDEIIKNRNN